MEWLNVERLNIEKLNVQILDIEYDPMSKTTQRQKTKGWKYFMSHGTKLQKDWLSKGQM